MENESTSVVCLCVGYVFARGERWSAARRTFSSTQSDGIFRGLF